MKRIFTILAFTVLTVISSFGQSYDEYSDVDELDGQKVHYIESDVDSLPGSYWVESIADFKIEAGGVVSSFGIIKVYDITGRLIATSSQIFFTSTLNQAGVYIIVAEEGVIKYSTIDNAWTSILYNKKCLKPLK